MSRSLESPNPLASSVLAMLKVARDLDVELTPETLAMLLYLADLDAIESGRTQFSGATWRWDDSGPYDHALMRAEEWVVESELVERREAPHADRDSYVLTVTVDIEDPLNAADMECVRSVVRLHGGRGVTGLEELSAETAPVIEAQVAGDRGVLLDLNRARRRQQVRARLERFRSRRAARPPVEDSPGVDDALRAEFLEMRAGLRRVNVKMLDDQ
ncbi:hypothetical protein ACIBF6_44845 [Streptosporangium amethystogenes]|uniref:hypothetical protein n=1 Tax=Streptosporangium amethystogenes TaxID=2002 RepID=UPI0037BA3787